ncbi:hypothetical protein ACFV4P_16490 [Kitasatospora sp. NPDC059795]|uniref:hypothetical protein n=1 Tax=Kitasatospora sp. NPDC059795 TaxID=3346949 RepID=UPI00365A9610
MSVPLADRRRVTHWIATVGGLLVVAVLMSLAGLLPTAAGAAPVSASPSATAAPAAPVFNRSGGSGSSGNGDGPAQADAPGLMPGATSPTPQNLVPSGVPTPSKPPRPVSYPSTPSPTTTDGPCPFLVAPQALVKCGAAPNTETLFKLDVAADHDQVIIQTSGGLYGMTPQVFRPDGTPLKCDVSPDPNTPGPARCVTDKAGSYTLRLYNYGSKTLPIAMSYLPVVSAQKCVAIGAADRSLGNPTIYRGTVPLGMAGDCYTTDFATGDVVRQLGPGLTWTVFDATGRDVCGPDARNGTDCRLAGTAPYRAVVQYGSGPDRSYQLALSRLSRPEGCTVVEPQAYGVALDLADTSRCRILRVPTDGRYTFRGISTSGETGGTVYRSDLSTPCLNGECDLTVGDYLFTTAPSISKDPYAVVFRSATETRGCTVGRDDQMASGAPVEKFGSAGQDICRTLPTASGQGLHMLNGTTSGETASFRVLDATGAGQCGTFPTNDTYTACRLTGTAPFRLVANARGPVNYRLLVQRTGETAGCTPWGTAGYGTGSGLRTGLSGNAADGALEACFSVPADHPATELIGYQVAGPDDEAELHLVDLSGNDFCGIAYLETCRPPTGRPYTAVLRNGRGLGKYTVVRRDATPSAACDLPVSSGRVGAPSTALAYESTVDAHCTAFDADRADLFQVSMRTATNSYGAFNVLDADGKQLCRWDRDCRVTGSTRYLAVATSLGVDAGRTPDRLDVWRLATAAGWAPECAAHPISADGFDQRSGVLSDDAPLYCAVLEMRPGQTMDVTTATEGFVERPRLTVAGRENWANGDIAYKCTQDDASNGTGTTCTYNGTTTGHAVMLLSPGHAHLPLAYTLQGARPGTGTARSGVPESVSPNVLPAGGLPEMTVHGTGLSLNTQFVLIGATRACGVLEWRPLRVNAEGTELVVRVNLQTACTGADGAYDLLITGAPHQDGVPSPGYLPKALKVTA